jgi:aspartate/methionine/tyrosine aminotransferase
VQAGFDARLPLTRRSEPPKDWTAQLQRDCKGLRIGWLIAQPELLARAVMCKQFSDAHTSTFAQATAAAYLAAGRMPATLANVRRVYAQRAQALGDALRRELGDAVEFTAPQGGLFEEEAKEDG